MRETKTQLDFTSQMNDALTGIAVLGNPTDGKFRYPSDKRRTQQNTDAMQEAEKNLDRFWSAFDSRWQRLVRKTIDQSMGEHVLSHRNRALERTATWVEPLKIPKQIKPAEFQPLKEDKTTADTSISLAPKAKPKTRGVATKLSELEAPAVAPKQVEDKQPIFKVDKRAYKAFTTLFYIPNQSDQPGEIPWRDFLHAMNSTGFAPEKLYGSIWQFTPTKLDVERSIQFHEPHPAVKIPSRNARRIGRRLHRAYGWRGDMFVLE